MSYRWSAIEAPKISVVVCNYNYEKFICSTIKSVLTQTLKAYELVVVDDGSTDSSAQLVRENFPNVRLIVKSNEGQISAYNTGFASISGDVVVFLDSDDELLPNALEDISKCFKDDIVKVHGKMIVIDKDGVEFDTVLPSYISSGDCGSDLLNDGILYKSPPASANAYRVDALKLLFPIPHKPNEKHGADYFCIYGVSLLGIIAKINKPIIKYRLHQAASDTVNSLGFGNAVKMQNRSAVMQQRWLTLTEWLRKKLNNSFQFKLQYLDFTQQKLFYASDVLNADSIHDKYVIFKKHSAWIFKAINARRDLSLLKQFTLYVWVILLLLSPKKISFKLAKLICNPVK